MCFLHQNMFKSIDPLLSKAGLQHCAADETCRAPVPLQRQDEIVNLQPAIVQTKEGSTTSLSEPISVCFLSLQIFYLFLANVDI